LFYRLAFFHCCSMVRWPSIVFVYYQSSTVTHPYTHNWPCHPTIYLDTTTNKILHTNFILFRRPNYSYFFPQRNRSLTTQNITNRPPHLRRVILIQNNFLQFKFLFTRSIKTQLRKSCNWIVTNTLRITLCLRLLPSRWPLPTHRHYPTPTKYGTNILHLFADQILYTFPHKRNRALTTNPHNQGTSSTP
jgi:hypothetical protein